MHGLEHIGLHSETLVFITNIMPHVVILITTVLNFMASRKNGRRIKRIERALNSKEDNTKE